MKKLLLLSGLTMLLAGYANAACNCLGFPNANWWNIGAAVATNICVIGPSPCPAYLNAIPGQMFMVGTGADAATTPTLTLGNSLFGLDLAQLRLSSTGLRITGSMGGQIPLYLDGDLTVSGTVTAIATPITWQTNIVWSTNAFYYPTNSQVLAVDMNKHYGDLDVDGSVGAVNFSIDGSSLEVDVYQTATVILRNTTPASITNITGTTMHVSGTPWVTNRSICTFFRNGSSGLEFTNLVVLPLW